MLYLQGQKTCPCNVCKNFPKQLPKACLVVQRAIRSTSLSSSRKHGSLLAAAAVAPVFKLLSTERVLPAVDGIQQPLLHQLLRGILGQFDHEHACLHSDEPQVWRPCEQTRGKQLRYSTLQGPLTLYPYI